MTAAKMTPRAPLSLLLLLLLAVPAAMAQQSSSRDGAAAGNYTVKQSVEVGWRWTDREGSASLFNTLVDLHPGPRVLEHSLDLQSRNHQGLLFDMLHLSGFGYGGDPNSLTRLRVQKNRWYNLNASFRRSRNFWDYDLLANPLNPAASRPAAPVANSPHRFDRVRRMGDLNLLLAPQSPVRLRFAYSRNVAEGPAFTSEHEGGRQGVELLRLDRKSVV